MYITYGKNYSYEILFLKFLNFYEAILLEN